MLWLLGVLFKNLSFRSIWLHTFNQPVCVSCFPILHHLCIVVCGTHVNRSVSTLSKTACSFGLFFLLSCCFVALDSSPSFSFSEGKEQCWHSLKEKRRNIKRREVSPSLLNLRSWNRHPAWDVLVSSYQSIIIPPSCSLFSFLTVSLIPECNQL